MNRAFKGIVIFSLIALISINQSGAETLKPVESAFLSALPEVKKISMTNGINLLYLEDELPVTVIYASVSYGKLYETAENAGITDVLTKALAISGTTSYPGNMLNQTLESIGGELQITAGWETIGIEIKVLTRHKELAFSILGEILKNPLFDESGVESAKKLVLEKINRERDEPEETGVLKLREIIFGGAGYGSVPGEKSINSTDSRSLRAIWNRHATGGNITVAVSSSEKESGVITLAEKSLSGIVKGKREYYRTDNDRVLADLKLTSGNIYLIPMELEQATIYTGTVAPEIKYEGNYALYLMNYILGGGSFNSRLMNEIRVKRGLAYSVYSLVRNRRDTGVFISFVQTRNDSAAYVLNLMRENIERMYKEQVSSEELGWAKESVKNSYVFRFNTVNDLLGNFLEMEYNDLNSDYYRKYLDNINRVTVHDIEEESRKLFSRGLVTVVVGSRKLEKELSASGKVIIIE